MKATVIPVLTLILSLATWCFFYEKKWDLQTPETALITGFWFIIVFLAHWLWMRVRKSAQK